MLPFIGYGQQILLDKVQDTWEIYGEIDIFLILGVQKHKWIFISVKFIHRIYDFIL